MTGEFLFAFSGLIAALICEFHKKHGWTGVLILLSMCVAIAGLINH